MAKIINAAIHGTGVGTDSLTGKADVEGLTVSFDGEAPCFVSWKSFKQLLSFRSAQGQKEVKPAPATNGPAVATVPK